MLNHITIMGRLTRDPELRYTKNGVPVANFAVAVDRGFGGEKDDKQTDFFDCIAWRQTAEFVNTYLAKGRKVVVDGRIEFQRWTDRNGNNRSDAKLVVAQVFPTDSQRSGDRPVQAAPTHGGFGELEEDDEGDLPF